MKKLKMAIVILILLPVLIAVCHIYLNKSSERMANEVACAEKSARSGNESLSKVQIDEFLSDWDRNKPAYATFIRHAELDIANQSAAKLRPYLENDDKSNFYGECETIIMQIRHISETERFSIENIL